MTTHSVTALGKVVSYDPEAVLSELRLRFSNTSGAREAAELDLEVVTTLYRKLGHSLVTGEAGGILNCFRQGEHVSNVLLVAAGLV